MIQLIACIGKLIGAFGISAVCVLGTLYDDPWLKDRMEQRIRKTCSEAVGEPVSYSLESVDMLRGKIRGNGFGATSSQGDWSFFCPEVDVYFSWFSMLKGSGIEMSFTFSKPQVRTRYERGSFAIEKPLKALLEVPPFLPVTCTGCTITDSTLDVIATSGLYKLRGSSVTTVYPRAITHRIFTTDGSFTSFSKDVPDNNGLGVRGLSGTILVDIPLPNVQDYEMKASFLTDWRTRDGDFKKCVTGCSYKQGAFSFQWYPESCTAFVRTADMLLQEGLLKGSLELCGSLATITDCFPFLPLVEGLSGEVDFKGQAALGDNNDFSYAGTMNMGGLSYRGVALPSYMTMFLSGTQKAVEGTVTLTPFKGAALKGTWTYDLFAKQAKGDLSLCEPCNATSHLKVDKASCEFMYGEKGLTADYKAAARWDEGELYQSEGSLTADPEKVLCEGKVQGTDFSATLDKGSSGSTTVRYVRDGKAVVDVKQDQAGFRGIVDFDYLKKSIAWYTGHELQGGGQVTVEPLMQQSEYALLVEIKDAHIKVPFTHTSIIKSGRAIFQCDTTRNALLIKDLELEFAKGKIKSPCITIDLNNEGEPSFIHAPYTADSLFISLNKDVCGTLSGGGVATYAHGTWTFRGALILDKAAVKGNLLSTSLQSGVEELAIPDSLQNAVLDIHCTTRRPISIQTSFFEAQARLDMRVKGTLTAPQLIGSIELVQGSICFPYKPLYIAKGKLTMAPHMTQGPEIELIAKNKIKKYGLTMQVTGSVLDPKITFESSPHLSEDSIVTLLLTGSEDASFYMAMSHVVMMHIKSILFGTPDRLSDAQSFFKSLLTPLSKVRIVPTLNEDKVLEGAIEVDITDRLRAKAHNNVNLSDETQLELEYALSDDVTVKAVRDERGAVGGELEMRWKF